MTDPYLRLLHRFERTKRQLHRTVEIAAGKVRRAGQNPLAKFYSEGVG